jgi:hypothetical protein
MMISTNRQNAYPEAILTISIEKSVFFEAQSARGFHELVNNPG